MDSPKRNAEPPLHDEPLDLSKLSEEERDELRRADESVRAGRYTLHAEAKRQMRAYMKDARRRSKGP